MSSSKGRVLNDCNGKYEEDRQVYSSKGATVEVTVKVKKRRDHHDIDFKAEKKNFPKGSWGDLLCQNRVDEIKAAVKQDAKEKLKSHKKGDELKCCASKVSKDGHGDHPSPLCHKIPISKDLYLETHTHIRKRSASSSHDRKTSSSTHHHNRNRKDALPQQQQQNSNPQPRHKNASTSPPPSPVPVSHKSTNTSAIKVNSQKVVQVKEFENKVQKVEQEKEALRSEAAMMFSEMQKSKQEQQESVMTIKELYQLAELLKQENQQLIGAQKQQDFLEEKLIQAVTENQELRQYLQSLMKKQSESSNVHDDQLTKIRSVIEEVKSTIQEEIQGITTHTSQSSLYKPEQIRGFDLNISEGDSALLNDTNASEIQRILGSREQSRTKKEEQLAGIKAFLLSPRSTLDIISERASEAKSSSTRRYLKSTEDLSPVYSAPSNINKNEKTEDSFQHEVSRTFMPIQMELLNGSSSNSYRSTATSTPNNAQN